MNQFSRSIALWLVLGLMFLLLFNIFSRQQPKEPEIMFSDFLNQVDKGQVKKATIQGDIIKGEATNGDLFKVDAPTYPDLVKTLRDKGVEIAAKPAEGDPWWMVALVQWLPFLVLAAVWIFFMRQMQI
ncbi:MAG: ATP-dependent metallopeptidase FtsH/Yme1/Tma family protein, partial [Candidatus Binatus sp.]